MTTETIIANPLAVPGVSSIALASVTGAVAACSLIGNMFVFLTISKSKTLQRINNAMLLSLAVADLVRSSTVVPLYAALLLTDVNPSDQRWLCPLYTTVLVFCEMAVILNVTLIAAERVFVITKPLVYQRTVTLAKVSVIIASLWILSLALGAMQALRFLPESDNRSESAAFTSVVCFSVPSLGYAVFDVTLTLVLPVVTLVVCYGKIFFVVHSQMRRIAPVVSDTYGNSEAVLSYGGESWRHAYVTRSTSLSYRDSSTTHAPSLDQRRQANVFAIEVAPSIGREAQGPIAASISSNYFSTVRPPLSNIEEDRVESGRHSSDVGAQKRSDRPSLEIRGNTVIDHDKPIRILVTQPSRESLIPNTGINDQREVTLGNDDLLLPGAVPSAIDMEPILSAVYLNRINSVSRSEPAPFGPTPFRRGSSVTFDLRDTDQSTPDQHENDTIISNRTKRRGSNTTNQNSSGGSSLPPPRNGGSLNPALNRSWSMPRRPSHESSTSRVSVNPTPGGQGLSPPARRNSIARINDNKAFKMTLVVVGAFLVCWVPAKICYLLRVISGSLVTDLTFDIVTCLALAASALDPYIYNFYSSEFRRALKRVVTCSADKPDMPWM